MNKKGFTLVELLTTLVILGIVVSLTIVGMNISLNNTKKKTEEVFIGTIKDALKMYLDSDARTLEYNSSSTSVCTIDKALKDNVKIQKYVGNTTDNSKTIKDIINSKYSPLLESDLVNPNNENDKCKLNALVNIYRDDDYVYYYKMNKNKLGCLTKISCSDSTDFDCWKSQYITNLPDDCLKQIKAREDRDM